MALEDLGVLSAAVDPDELTSITAWAKGMLGDSHDATEGRRGFRQVHWDPPGGAGERRWELSLEHEARLRPRDDNAENLVDALLAAQDQNGILIPNVPRFAELTARRYRRPVGPQSIDRYYDVHSPSGTSVIRRGITLRERLHQGAFMTWKAHADAVPWNLELPFVPVLLAGMTARIEFNWVDTWERTRRAALGATSEDAQRRNPLFLASCRHQIDIESLVPVVQHTTFRHKFGLHDHSGAEVFVVNVDRVMAEDLATGRTGTYVDVDVSGVNVVDAPELERVAAFAAALAATYELVPNPWTKARRSALVTKHMPV